MNPRAEFMVEIRLPNSGKVRVFTKHGQKEDWRAFYAEAELREYLREPGDEQCP